MKALRDRTGAGMMDCKKALTESGGDIDKAIEILRVKQGKRIEDLGERLATEGTVQSYVHSNAKVGVLVEVDRRPTSSRATTSSSRSPTTSRCTSRRRAGVRQRGGRRRRARQSELRVYEQEAADKPENVRAKIVEGKLRKWYETVVLLKQAHVNGDKYDGKTIDQLRDEVRAKTGENVEIRRFARFAVGQ